LEIAEKQCLKRGTGTSTWKQKFDLCNIVWLSQQQLSSYFVWR